jgi:tetratricopeptide (TPR) repeat protein
MKHVKRLLTLGSFLFFLTLTSGLFGQTTDPDRQKAQEAYDRGNYAQCIIVCNKILSVSPNDADILYLRGSSYGETDQLAKALADLNRDLALCAKDDSENLSIIHSAIGKSYLNAEKYSEAVAGYNKAIELNGKDANNYSGRADCYFYSEKYPEAITDYTKAMSLAGTDKEYLGSLYFWRGKSYNLCDKYREALADFELAIKSGNTDVDVMWARAGNYFDQKEYAKAITDYTTVINASVNNKESLRDLYFWRGKSYLRLLKFNETLADFDLAVKAGNTDVELVLARAVANENIKEYAKAVSDYSIGISNRQNDKKLLSSLYFWRGKCYINLNKVKEAKDDYDLAISSGNTSIDVIWERAWAYYNLKEYVKAVADYTAVIAAKQNDKEALAKLYYWRGISYFSNNNNQAALDDLILAEKYGTSSQNLYWNMAKLYNSSGKYAESVLYYDMAISKGSDKKDLAILYWGKGKALSNFSKDDLAVEAFSKSIENDPGYRDSYWDRGSLYGKQSQYAKAIEDYRMAITNSPANEKKDNMANLYFYKAYYNDKAKGLAEATIKDYTTCLSYLPDYKYAFWNRAMAYLAMKDYRKSLDDLQKALALYQGDAAMIEKIDTNIATCKTGLGL